jgi:hypothetical protein
LCDRDIATKFNVNLIEEKSQKKNLKKTSS